MEGESSGVKPVKESSPIIGEGVGVEECQRMIQKSLRTPMLKFLLEHLEKFGCIVADNFIKAVNCEQQISGGYARGEGLKDFCCKNDSHEKSVSANMRTSSPSIQAVV